MIGGDDILDARGAAELLGIHEETLRRLARENKVPAFKVGGVWRFSKNSLYNWAGSQPARQTTKSVLVVDDEEYIRDTVGRTLQGEGFLVTTACGGAEALELMREHVPDLVLLDLKMPGMDGAATLKKIRETHGAIPVIIITGFPDSDLVNRALEYSPITLLAKPVQSTDLIQAVKMILAGTALEGG